VTRPLLVGQAPSRTCGTPWASDAGRRLARYMGVTHEELLDTFEARNLNRCHPGAAGKYDLFDLAEARETAAHMRRWVLPRREVALLCGMKVAECFGVEPMSVTRVGKCYVYALPHPAGTSMWWNDPSDRRRGVALARDAYAHGAYGCPVCYDRHPAGERTCLGWMDYWQALTPSERRSEECLMARYATEAST
jgi:uracil-DNA glycosylase